MDSITIRIDLWIQAFNAFLSAPWFGIGWGELPYWLYENSATMGMDRNAHNIFIHFMAETGIIGLALIVIVLLCSIPRNFRANDVPLYGIAAIMFFHSLVEFPYAYMQYLIIFGLVLGMTQCKK